MDVEWSCIINGREFGPLSTQEIRAMAQRGDLQGEDLVRRGKGSQWVPARKVKGLLPTSGAHPTVTPKASKPGRDRRPLSSGRVVPLEEDEAEEPLPLAEEDDQASALPVAQSRAKGAKGRAAPAAKTPPRLGSARPVPVSASRGGPAVVDPAAELEMIANAAYSGAPLSGGKAGGSEFRPHRRKGIPPMAFALIGALGLVAVLLIVAVVMNNQPGPGTKATADAAKNAAPAENAPSVDAAPQEVISGEKLEAKCLDDSVLVSVHNVEVGYAKFNKSKNPAIRDFAARYLKLTLQIENINKERKLTFNSWNVSSSGIRPVAIDNHRNTYNFRQFPPGTVEGQLEKAPLMPNDPLKDVLLFEEPVTAVNTIIRIKLPTQAFGEAGTVDLDIPITKIKKEDNNPELDRQAKTAATDAAREAATKASATKKGSKTAPTKAAEKKSPPKTKRPSTPAFDDDTPPAAKPKKPENEFGDIDLENTKGLPPPKPYGPNDH